MKKIKTVVFPAILIIFILITSVINLPLVLEPTKELVMGEVGFSEYVSNVKTAYTSNFTGKNAYVNLNGLFAKVTGRKAYNEIAKIKNGMLINESMLKVDMGDMAKGISEFSRYLEESGRQYIYVQAPYKMDAEKSLLPTGVENFTNENANELLKLLAKENVSTIDLRTNLTADAKSVEQNFFYTDHHWNSKGAFEAFKIIVEHINSISDEPFSTDFADINNWQSHTLENWFLGSLGKRVGAFFAGTDDFTYYTPNFETKISRFVSNHRTFDKGDFTTANLDLKYLDGKDYFGHNVYCLYIGGDYPLVKHRNIDAPSKTKILLIKDSFSLPVQSFLSTVFAEVDVVDPRYFKECNVAEYVELSNPDIIISLTNPSVFREDNYYTFKTESAKNMAQKQEREAIIDGKNITVPFSDKKHNYINVATGLENGTQYTFTVKDIEVLKGETDGATVILYDKDTQKLHSTQIFDIGYCKEKGEFEWSFLTPEKKEGELCVLVYSGIHGSTQGKEVAFKNIKLEKHY